MEKKKDTFNKFLLINLNFIKELQSPMIQEKLGNTINCLVKYFEKAECEVSRLLI